MNGPIFYVDNKHPNAKNDDDHGPHIDAPWKTPGYALFKLRPGDTLLIRGSTYSNQSIRLTEQNSGQENFPITVQAYQNERVIFNEGNQISFHGAGWWVIDGLIFNEPKGQIIQVGLHQQLGHPDSVISHHLIIKNCEFKNGRYGAITLEFADNIQIINNHFYNIRPGTSFLNMAGEKVGWELNAIGVRYKGNNITIAENRFEDIGSDGVQLGSKSKLPGAKIENVQIVGNDFWVNRPYQGSFGNVGENGIDVKQASNILIAKNLIHGFRPTRPEQDASGADGEGVVIHNDAEAVVIEQNYFLDNTIHLAISQGKSGTGKTGNITVRNNIFEGAKAENRGQKRAGGFALKVSAVANVKVSHNTFLNNEIFLRSWNISNALFTKNVVSGGRVKINPVNAKWQADQNAWVNLNGNLPDFLQGNHDLVADALELDQNLLPAINNPAHSMGHNLNLIKEFRHRLRPDTKVDTATVSALDSTTGTSSSQLDLTTPGEDIIEQGPHLEAELLNRLTILENKVSIMLERLELLDKLQRDIPKEIIAQLEHLSKNTTDDKGSLYVK